jgi:hypothetical protein
MGERAVATITASGMAGSLAAAANVAGTVRLLASSLNQRMGVLNPRVHACGIASMIRPEKDG